MKFCYVCLTKYKGRIKNNVEIKNRSRRYAYLLWEFWKEDHQLFPSEIVNKKAKLETRPHAVIFVFDGSTEEVPSTEEETRFYRQVLKRAKSQGVNLPFCHMLIY